MRLDLEQEQAKNPLPNLISPIRRNIEVTTSHITGIEE